MPAINNRVKLISLINPVAPEPLGRYSLSIVEMHLGIVLRCLVTIFREPKVLLAMTLVTLFLIVVFLTLGNYCHILLETHAPSQ